VRPDVLAACRRGEPWAFEEVVRLTHRHVYSLALRLVGDPQEAEDVAQDAYLRVYRGLAGFRGDAAFETWLYRVGANAAISHLRRRRRFGPLLSDPADEPSAPRAGPVQVPFDELAVDRDSLVRALDSLPPAMRLVVVLKDVYDLPCAEIGRMVGASEGAVTVRLHRARRRLKERLLGPEERRRRAGEV
jgi:RNA polymerase sigma-70 factor (ECF subfamily)